MKIAAIDVGSNSIHMIIIESRDGMDFEIVDREKEMVRLGSGTFQTRRLSEAAMARAEACLRKYKQLAERLQADRIIAKATSAVREAQNGGDFITRIHERVGIHVEVITSAEEARLIALAVQHSIDFRGRRALLIDIGGGSVEFSVCDAWNVHFAESRKLGVLRLAEKFVARDPMSKKVRRSIEKFVKKRVADVVREAHVLGFSFGLGTSGTILTLADVAHQVRRGGSLRHFHQEVFHLADLVAASKRLQAMTLKERSRFEGVNLARAATIVAGGILLETLMRQFGLNQLTLCTRALREGMVLEFLARQRERLGGLNLVPNVRRRSVLDLARRSNYDRKHAEWVAATALAVFDATRHRHRLGDDARELLEFAALLHDIGIQISYTRHHRHSQYIILNSDLRGFNPEEVEILALLARFHRKSEPSRKDPECALMTRMEFETLKKLSAILRLTDGIDRSHHQILDLVALRKSRGRWRFDFVACDESELELWGARRKGALFEKVFEGPLDFRVTMEARRVRRESLRLGGARRPRQGVPARQRK